MTIITKASLAAELGITKSRVSQYLKRGMPVRSDGKLDRENALNWITSSHANDRQARHAGVKRANDITKRTEPRPVTSPRAVTRSDILIESMISRTVDWREIFVEDPPAEREAIWFDVTSAAEHMSVEPGDLLTWLRAGCPYAVEGDWATGVGFKLKMVWLSEWVSLVLSRLAVSGDHASMRTLRLASLLRERTRPHA